LEKNRLRFALSQLEIAPRFSSTIETANRSLALRSSAALVSVQLAQVWQHPSDDFSRSGSCDRIVAEESLGLGKMHLPPVKTH
jgi:hypothetical protein